jgi:hypothetical protein
MSNMLRHNFDFFTLFTTIKEHQKIQIYLRATSQYYYKIIVINKITMKHIIQFININHLGYIMFMFNIKYINFSIQKYPCFKAEKLFMYALIISICVHDMYHTRCCDFP